MSLEFSLANSLGNPILNKGVRALGVLDANFASGVFFFNGQRYADEAALLIGMGGSKSGEARTFGPFVTGANILVNGDLSDGATGWTNQNSGLSSVAGGELVLDGNGGTNPSSYHAVTTEVSRGYLLRGTHRRGASAGTSTIIAMNAALTSLGVGSNNTTQTPLSDELGFGAEGTTSNVALRIPLSATSAQAIGDNFEVVPAQAFDGYAPTSFSGRIDFTSPASLASDVALFELTGSKVTNVRNRIIGILRASDGHLVVTVTFGASSAASLDLGAVSLGASHYLDFSFATNRFMASLDGGDIVGDTAGTMPGAVRLYVGRSNAGQTWTGTIDRLVVYDAERVPAKAISMDGDSYSSVSGSGGVSGQVLLAASTARPVFSTGVGGSTLAEQVARVVANPGAYRGIFVHIDGDANGYGTLETDMALYAQMFSALGHSRFVFVPPFQRANKSGADNAATLALRNALMAAYPNNHVDGQAVLAAQAVSPGDDATVAAGQIPASMLQGDEVHLTSAAMDIVTDALAAFILAKGW